MAISGAGSAEAAMARAAQARTGEVTQGPGRLAGVTNVSEQNRAQTQPEALASAVEAEGKSVAEIAKQNKDLLMKEEARLKAAMQGAVDKNDSAPKRMFGVPAGDSPTSSMSGIGPTMLAIEQEKGRQARVEA